MDQLTHFRAILLSILDDYGQYRPAYGEIELERVVDPVNDHYQLLSVGWQNHQRVHGCLLHIDIRDNKIWIQHDGTEEGVATRLVAAGIPKESIVLGFQSPFKRQFTEFAVG
jgi:hypothetical protein